MTVAARAHFVSTIRERCRVCYTCVRECPAKAIRISGGQAEVLPERCICCGNCVKVCSQKAKQIVDTSAPVRELLASGRRVAACLAPSFPAEFPELDHRRLVGALRRLGFSLVNEVAFGADLVADRYRRLLALSGDRRWIATSCPALVTFVERYHPGLVGNLAPVVSPMIATARALRRLHGRELAVVFVGPCIAKKLEVEDPQVPGELDAAITYAELRGMLAAAGVDPAAAEPSEFDEPHAGLGALFPISRGLLQAAGISEDLLDGHVVAADGRTSMGDVLNQFEAGVLDARLLEVLCCHGCIMGPGYSQPAQLFERRAAVSAYVRSRQESADSDRWRQDLERFQDLDLSRNYAPQDRRVTPGADDSALREVLARMGKHKPEDELNCGACGYDTCRDHAAAIVRGLAESEMCLPYTIEQLKVTVRELASSNQQLASAQAALMQAEKLANMGQLAAGIAHEINNPLGIVLLYAHSMLEEARDGAARQDLGTIVEQADRCRRIVSGLLHFARRNKVFPQPTDLGELVEHTLGMLHLPETIKTGVKTSCADPRAEVDRDQMAQVLTNLFTNAQDAMPEGGELAVAISEEGESLRLDVRDTGRGIKPEFIDKIFEPFFTTKQIGRGTGLGLAVTYGIVKMHRGHISVKSNADPAKGPTGTTFTVTLPRKALLE